MAAPTAEDLRNDIIVIDAALETLRFQISNLQSFASAPQVRCWRIQMRKLKLKRRKKAAAIQYLTASA